MKSTYFLSFTEAAAERLSFFGRLEALPGFSLAPPKCDAAAALASSLAFLVEPGGRPFFGGLTPDADGAAKGRGAVSMMGFSLEDGRAVLALLAGNEGGAAVSFLSFPRPLVSSSCRFAPAFFLGGSANREICSWT